MIQLQALITELIARLQKKRSVKTGALFSKQLFEDIG